MAKPNSKIMFWERYLIFWETYLLLMYFYIPFSPNAVWNKYASNKFPSFAQMLHSKPSQTNDNRKMTYDNGQHGHISTTMDSPPMIMFLYYQLSMLCLPFRSLYLMELIYSTLWHKVGFWSGKSQCWLVIDVRMQDFWTLYGVDLVPKAKLEMVNRNTVNGANTRHFLNKLHW